MRVVNWFGRQKRRVVVPRLHSRGEAQVNVNKVDLAELTPELEPFLAQAAYLQLTVFETLAGAVAEAPTTSSKEAVSRAAALSLDKHHGLVAELSRKGIDAAESMKQYAPRIDEYRDRTLGTTWHETMVTAYVTAGLLDDFYRRLATGLPVDAAARVAGVLTAEDGHELIVAELKAAIDENPRLAFRLAMWGRRLVGDTLLIARSALAMPTGGHTDEARLEPVFTEIIAAHTRRMDALGLTA
jgi:hypothetical protein